MTEMIQFRRLSLIKIKLTFCYQSARRYVSSSKISWSLRRLLVTVVFKTIPPAIVVTGEYERKIKRSPEKR